MSRRRSSWLVAVVMVLLAALGVVGASAAPPPRCNGPQRSHALECDRHEHTRRLSRLRPEEQRPPSRSTWGWSRARFTTQSTRSRRSITGHICSRGGSLARASGEAAVATAAYRVLTHIVATAAREYLIPEEGERCKRSERNTTRRSQRSRELPQAAGDRCGERCRRRDDRRTARGRTLRGVAVDAEPAPRPLGPGGAERDDVQDPAPSVGDV